MKSMSGESIVFKERICRVVTLHGKQEAIAPCFSSILGMKTMSFPIDTDQFGTFAGDVERTMSPAVCAKEKCLTALRAFEGQSPKGCFVASEGSFGPHPVIPFTNCGQELLFFMDCDYHFELVIRDISFSTNFSGQTFCTIQELEDRIFTWQFPSHALVVRPNVWKKGDLLFKGIDSLEELQSAFVMSQAASFDGRVWVQTDMRAHKNPTRMQSIKALAQKLADRLSVPCPACGIPGWGVIDHIPGLACKDCNTLTDLTAWVVWGCCKCSYIEKKGREDGQLFAEPAYCPYCNP